MIIKLPNAKVVTFKYEQTIFKKKIGLGIRSYVLFIAPNLPKYIYKYII